MTDRLALGEARPAPRLPSRLGRLLEWGTLSYPPRVRRRLKILNGVAGMIAVSSLLYAAIYAIADLERYRWLVAINLGLVAMALLVPALHRFGDLAAALLITGCEVAALFGLAAMLGRSAGIQLNLFVGAAGPFVVFGSHRRALIVAVVLTSFALHVAAWFLFEDPLIPVAPDLVAQLYVSSAADAFAVIAIMVHYAFRLVEDAEAQSDALLRNILPGAVADRLLARPGAIIADSFAEASVLFTDLAGFTAIAQRLGAERTVAMLDDLVRAFDTLSERHRVEKIKTIGDAYMAVAGVPVAMTDHCARIVRLALDMQGAVVATERRFRTALKLRIGIASGPVMAGVIGRQKFTYDVWGDAVNLASRLEHAGPEGGIHVSPAVRQALGATYDFVPCGPIDLKGFGQIETWLLATPEPAAAASNSLQAPAS
jgi:adenylate cyclase